MKIAILYICTGKYDIFWKDFYLSSEKYFFKNEQKHYFVFTDSNNIYDSDSENVEVIYQENLSWPGNTLFRFKMFKRIEEKLKNYDYIFFLNGNALFLQAVDKEILPEDDRIIVVQHPGFFDKKREEFTYDNNPKSLAYIAPNEGEVYVCGGFNGGTSSAYLEMINELNDNIDKDYENNIIALWHDESHINKYILNHKYKLLPASYMAFDEKEMPFEKKVIVRDKEKYGGHEFLRGEKVKLSKKIKKLIKKMIGR